jgi:phosphatidylglycerophosphate synthase
VKAIIPNLICVSRILLAIILAAVSANELLLAIFAFFVFVSDNLDGILARRWKVTSDFGAALDHVSDKIVMLFFTFDLLLHHDLPLILAFLLALRDYLSDMLKNLARDKGIHLPVSKLAKYKSALFFIWLTVAYLELHVSSSRSSPTVVLGAIGLLVLSYGSLFAYGQRFIQSRH